MTARRGQGRVVVVTGAGSGIGRATALRFAQEGASLWLLDRAPIADAPAGARCVKIDVVDTRAVEIFVAQFSAADIAPDVLVNAAGVGSIGTIEETPVEEFKAVLDINLHGTYRMCHALLPLMRARRSGAIVNIGSTFGLLARERNVAYAVSKAAVIHLTRCLAVDLADCGVRVNCVCPGIVETPMTAVLYEPAQRDLLEENFAAHALRRGAQPAEIAEVIAFLASDRASFMTGDIVPVDGGYTAGKWLQRSVRPR